MLGVSESDSHDRFARAVRKFAGEDNVAVSGMIKLEIQAVVVAQVREPIACASEADRGAGKAGGGAQCHPVFFFISYKEFRIAPVDYASLRSDPLVLRVGIANDVNAQVRVGGAKPVVLQNAGQVGVADDALLKFEIAVPGAAGN